MSILTLRLAFAIASQRPLVHPVGVRGTMTKRTCRLVILLVLGPMGALGRPSAPVGLLINGVNHPLAVERESVCFTWMSEDTKRGAAQAAYQILVASTRERLCAGS